MDFISNNKVCVEDGDVCYTISRINNFETNSSFKIRLNFIKNAKPKNKKEFDKIVQYSEILSNKILLGCNYASTTEKELSLLKKK